MALDNTFKALDIREVLDATHMRGKNITFLDDFSKDEIMSLFQAAQMLEPFMRTGTDLLKGKVLYTLFFQPSTCASRANTPTSSSCATRTTRKRSAP